MCIHVDECECKVNEQMALKKEKVLINMKHRVHETCSGTEGLVLSAHVSNATNSVIIYDRFMCTLQSRMYIQKGLIRELLWGRRGCIQWTTHT